MVGLPARGKTYLANKLRRYCSWLGFRTKSFNTSEYRRNLYGAEKHADYFDPANEDGLKRRDEVANIALTDLFKYLGQEDGQIGIFDGTNVTKERQALVQSYLSRYQKSSGSNFQLIWIESICNDEELLKRNILETELFSPDYRSSSSQIEGLLFYFISDGSAIDDFSRRIEFYAACYNSIEDMTQSFIKIYDIGRRFTVNLVDGIFTLGLFNV